jgi:hypothetical protein
MQNLAEEIQRITMMLEEAISEREWEIVQEQITSLDKVHDELERQENGFDYEYE